MSVNFDPEDLESRERYSYRSVVPGADTAQAVVNPDGSLVGSSAPAGGATSANQVLEIAALNEIATDTDHLDANLSTLATSSAQATGNASLASLNSKTVHVDTGNVTISSSALPTGAATSANQTNGTQVTSVNNFPATQPVSAVSLPLPTNAAQETGGNLDLIGTLAVENGGNLQSIQTNTANTEFYVQAHLPSIDTNTTTIATDTGNIATSTSSSATSLTEIATDTDNLATILANQTNGTQKALNTAALVPVAFDTIQVTAVDGSDRPTTVLYKTGGLAGSTVATLTIVYDGSGNFQSVVRT